MRLLTVNNPKTLKGAPAGYLSFVLHLAPSNMSGFNTCPMATTGCRAACLNTAGRGGLFPGNVTKNLTGAELRDAIHTGQLRNRIQEARIWKTVMYFTQRDIFMARLVREIQNGITHGKKIGKTPVFRLNATSDIRWETVRVTVGGILYRNIMAAFPGIQFYDYTAIVNRTNIPANYHLTFSAKENNAEDVATAIANGLNVAVVFRNAPVTYLDRPVINGDKNDLRFTDPSGCIVGLTAKGKAKYDTTGFVK